MNEEFVNEHKDRIGVEDRVDKGLDYNINSSKINSRKNHKNNYNMEISSEFLDANVEVIQAFKNLDYAELGDRQEKRMQELEKQFNSEFDTNFYFMIMKQD